MSAFRANDCTSTTTYTIPAPEPAPITSTHESKIKGLLVNLKKACEKLPADHIEAVREAISEWETIVLQEFNADSPLEMDRTDVIYALCYLYHNNIQYITLKCAENPNEMVSWLMLGKELKSILAGLLPHGRQVDEFLKMYVEKIAQQEYLSEIEKVDLVFKKMQDKLYEQANKINSFIIAGFEKCKADLLQINRMEGVAVEVIHDRLDALTVTLNQLFQRYGESNTRLEEVLERIEVQGEVQAEIAEDADELLKEV